MPRFASQNLAAFGAPTHISSDGPRRFCYGKQRNVIILGGNKLLSDGICLRLLPTYNTDDDGRRILDATGTPSLTPFRVHSEFGDWCRHYECVSWFGQPGLHFIVYDGNPAINRYDSPVWLLYQAAYKNKETPGLGPLFCDLLNRQAGYGQQTHVGSLKRPDQILFVSAAQVFLRGDKRPGLGCYDLIDQKEGNARIFGFKKTAAESLLNAFRVQDADENYLCGDMLNDQAKLITVISKSYGAALQPRPPRPHGISIEGPEYVTVPYYAMSNANPNETVILGKVIAKPDAKLPIEQHSVVLHDTFNGQRVTLDAYTDQVRNQNSTFDEFMYVPTFEEQAALMADSFPHEALDFAWRDRPEYLRALQGRNRTTVAVPSAPESAPSSPDREISSRATPVPAAPTSPAIITPWDDLADELPEETTAAFSQLQSAMGVAKPPVPVSISAVVAQARAKAAAAKR